MLNHNFVSAFCLPQKQLLKFLVTVIPGNFPCRCKPYSLFIVFECLSHDFSVNSAMQFLFILDPWVPNFFFLIFSISFHFKQNWCTQFVSFLKSHHSSSNSFLGAFICKQLKLLHVIFQPLTLNSKIFFQRIHSETLTCAIALIESFSKSVELVKRWSTFLTLYMRTTSAISPASSS